MFKLFSRWHSCIKTEAGYRCHGKVGECSNV